MELCEGSVSQTCFIKKVYLETFAKFTGFEIPVSESIF